MMQKALILMILMLCVAFGMTQAQVSASQLVGAWSTGETTYDSQNDGYITQKITVDVTFRFDADGKYEMEAIMRVVQTSEDGEISLNAPWIETGKGAYALDNGMIKFDQDGPSYCSVEIANVESRGYTKEQLQELVFLLIDPSMDKLGNAIFQQVRRAEFSVTLDGSTLTLSQNGNDLYNLTRQ